jgi:hypothetical protein
MPDTPTPTPTPPPKKLSMHLYWKTVFPLTIVLIIVLYSILIFSYPSDSNTQVMIANSVKNIQSALNVKGTSY